MRARFGWVSMFFATASAACGGDDGTASEDTIPAAPQNGVQIVTSDFAIPPGQESQSCYYTTLANEQEVFVRRFDAFQAEGGHHVILMTPLQDKPDGTVEDCTEGATMVNYVPLVLSLELNHFDLADGLSIRLPPHAKVVVQSHYLNASQQERTVRDVVNLEFLQEGVTPIPAAFWASAYLNLAVPPQRESTLTYRCTAQQPMQLLSLIGHMHEHGSSVTIDVGPPDALRRVYSVDTWDASFRDTPPPEQWTMDAPLQINAGDVMDVTCNWNSTAAQVLTFPTEMCGSNAWVFPAEGSVTCAGSLLSGDAAGG